MQPETLDTVGRVFKDVETTCPRVQAAAETVSDEVLEQRDYVKLVAVIGLTA